MRGEKESWDSYCELSSRLAEKDTKIWEEEETEALQKGGDALAIYGVKHDEGMYFLFPQWTMVNLFLKHQHWPKYDSN